MKNKLLFIIIPMSFCLCSYLIGCFYSTTFNIAKWSEDTRLYISILLGVSVLIGVLVSAAIHDITETSKRLR